MGVIFGLVRISAELRVDSVQWVLQGVEMVCLVGFSTHFTTKVVHNGILEGFQIQSLMRDLWGWFLDLYGFQQN